MFKSLAVSGAKRFSRFDREHYSFLITELANGSVHVSVFDHTTKLQQGIWVGNDNELTRQALNTIMLTYTIKPDATSSDAVTKLISGLPLRQTDHQVDEKTKVDAGGN